MSYDPPRRPDARDTTSSLPQVTDESPPDRMAVHAVWEIGLLLLAGGVLFALTQSGTGPFADGSWGGLTRALAPAVLLASAVAVSLRVGAVNLAVGPIAMFSAWLFVDASGSGLAMSLGIALGAAAFVAVGLAVMTAWLRVPGWAASGAVGGAIGLWSGTVADPAVFMLAELPATGVLAALGAAAGLSLFMGLVGAFAGVRDKLAPIRDTPVGDRHGRGGIVFLGVLTSGCLAGGAGVLFAWGNAAAGPAAAIPDPIVGTVAALGAALLGGTSLFGRRGGVFGTFLAATFLLTFMWLAESREWLFNTSWLALGAVVVGFLVTRLVEAMNAPDEEEVESTSRAGEVDDLREDDPPLPAQRAEEFDYDEDLAAVGAGADPWSTEQDRADPFGPSGAFDDLRASARDEHGRTAAQDDFGRTAAQGDFGSPPAQDDHGRDTPRKGGPRYDDVDGRYGRFR